MKTGRLMLAEIRQQIRFSDKNSLAVLDAISILNDGFYMRLKQVNL
jgi:hypothetical protein